MSPDGRLVQVEIFGQTYRLRADEDAEYVETLASYVDERMRDVSRQTNAVDTLKVAILTALNIADDHHRYMRENRVAAPEESREPSPEPEGTERAVLENRISEWNQILDEAIGG
jgi:cell division protein ZapA